MTNHATPSRDPADDDSLLGMVRQILGKFAQNLDDCLPARVISYDRNTNRATVVPMVKLLTTDGQQIGRAQIASVPVMQFGGGGVVLSFDIKPGDLGWIKANDRDISLMLRAYKDSAPNTLRKHSFQDSVFIPDVMTGYSIATEDAGNAVLQTLDGSVKVAIWPDRVKIAAGALSAVLGPSNISLTNGAAGMVMSPTNTTFTGPVVMPNGATIGGVPFGTHVHSDPQGGVTGGPQ